jgi:hypothetical protein
VRSAILALFAAAAIAMAVGAEPAMQVLHAEPPQHSPLARIYPGIAEVLVEVGADGTVLNVTSIPQPRPFVGLLSEAAARKWRFSAATEGEAPRKHVIAFHYLPPAVTDKPSYREVLRVDDSSLSIRYYDSTIQWLDRLADGTLPEKFCPRHGVRMDVGTSPIQYGLPRMYSDGVPADRIALRQARTFSRARERLFPEAHPIAGQGGCMVGPEKEAETYYCAVCRHARAEWLQRHPSFKQYE